MTKAEIVTKIVKKTGIDKPDVQIVVEALLQVIQSAMAEGENVYFKGFGRFVNKKRAKKVARNLSENTAIIIDEHYVPSLKPSKAFVAKIREAVKV